MLSATTLAFARFIIGIGVSGGKSITAINILTCLTAFAVQFLMGWIIHFWEILFPGNSLILGYQIAFGAFLIVQIMALVWFLL